MFCSAVAVVAEAYFANLKHVAVAVPFSSLHPSVAFVAYFEPNWLQTFSLLILVASS